MTLVRLTRAPAGAAGEWDEPADEAALQGALNRVQMPQGAHSVTVLPGPTGESNRLSLTARSPVLCLGPGARAAAAQVAAVQAMGGVAVAATGQPDPMALARLTGFSGVIWWGDEITGRALTQGLAARPGPILPLITDHPDQGHALLERHLCIDTTASGGNAELLAEMGMS